MASSLVSLTCTAGSESSRLKKYLLLNLAIDDKYKLIEAMDANWQGALPYTMLVEPGGKIAYSKQGAIDPQEIKKLIVNNPYIGRYYK